MSMPTEIEAALPALNQRELTPPAADSDRPSALARRLAALPLDQLAPVASVAKPWPGLN